MSAPDLFRMLQVVFGIGLVIFVHEAGHFFAARLCGVRVDVFSLGFGPRLFGWRRGATLYQIAAIPVGGYVKMAGEMADGSGRPPAPDHLVSKSVWQRFFIYSGGVLMNVAFALVVFPIVLAAGVPTSEPYVVPDKGSPAWKAGIRPGSLVLSVDGDEVYDFFHIPNEVALAGDGPLELEVLAPGAQESTRVSVTPLYNENGGFRQIGVRPGFDPAGSLAVDPDGPAWAAGMRDGDRWLAVDGVPSELPLIDQIARAFGDGQPCRIHVQRGDEQLAFDVTPTSKPTERLFLGIAPLQNRVAATRPGEPRLDALHLVEGERLLSIAGRPIAQPREVLDALLAAASSGEAAGVEWVFESRDGTRRTATLTGTLDERTALSIDDHLYLDYDPDSTRVYVQDGRAAASAGLRTGDRLVAVGPRAVQAWPEIYEETVRAAKAGGVVVVAYERRATPDGPWEAGEAIVDPTPSQDFDYGFGPRAAQGVYRTHSLGASIEAGFDASWRFLTDAWLTLKKMLTRQVSTENLGGIITIGTVSYSFAAEGWAKLFFFLCMLSINLAFLNVLPIPVLDGGHLFFCLVEAVKGSPVSERTLGYSQVVGLVLILTLMVYVTYQDVLRILP